MIGWQLVAKLGKRKGIAWPIQDLPLTIGRAAECDVVVDDPSVSRAHGRIWCEQDMILFEDLGSSNSTLVNAKPVARCVLQAGDELSIGTATFIVGRAPEYGDSHSLPETARTTVQFRLPAVSTSQLLPDAREILARPRHVVDLVQLHELATSLVACTNLDEMAARVLKQIHEAVSDARCAWVHAGDSGSLEFIPAGMAPNAAVREKVHTCILKDMPVVIEGTLQYPVWCAIPAGLPGHTRNGLLLQCGRELMRELLDVLGFVMAVAHTVAPYLLRIDVLEQRTGLIAGPRDRAAIESALVGESEPVQQARNLVELAAQVDLPVLIQGETGTGKELVARLVHGLSCRSAKPFVPVNSAAVPDSLFESEFFGHSKGAFTGAVSDRAGLFKQADGGILFLDEVADLSPINQAKLLRAVESGEYRPVGAGRDEVSDVRVVAASNRRLIQAVKSGTFRQDLYYRLCGLEITLPPLRERGSDIPLLFEHFARQFAAVAGTRAPRLRAAEAKAIAAMPWEGNVRELRTFVQRMTSLGRGASFSDLLSMTLDPDATGGADNLETMEAVERAHIAKVLAACGGHQSQTASILGMHRNTLRAKIKQYNL